MKRKNHKRKFEDSVHKKVTRSNDRIQRKSKRHQTKNQLHNFVGKEIDNSKFYDMIDELEENEWS